MAADETSNALESALDELYGVDPSEFVAVRKRLAGELKSAGDKDGAKTLLAARRPTTAAWAMNQLSRRDPDLVESFLEAGRDLQTAQGKGGPDAREQLRDATRAHRDALAATTDGAMAILESRATDGFRTQILATLHAASVDETVADQLAHGRLFKEVTGSTGFPDFPGLTLVPDLEPDAEPTATESEAVPKSKRMPPKRGTSPAKEKERPSKEKESAAAEKARRAEEQKRAREEAAAAELAERRAEAESAWEEAQDEATAAESTAEEAQERVDQLERDLVQARRDAKAADDRATSARREAARLARAVMKLQQ